MIVACPECSGPFEIPDDQIAAIVQIACPHCTFRMILDFEAANDPKLVEHGMRMASGYRHAGDYWAAVSGARVAPAAPAPRLQPVPEPEPEPEREPAIPATAHAVSAARAPAPVAQPAPPAEPPAPTPAAASSARVTPARHPPASPAAEPPQPGKREPTLVGPLPPRPGVPTAPEAAPSKAAEISAPIESDEISVQVESPAQEIPRVAEAPPVEERLAPRRPPHTPPARAAATGLTADEAAPEPDSDADLALAPDEEAEVAKGGFGTWLVAALVLMAVGLVGASVALKGTPDPRPLLEDWYRQTMK